MAVTKAGVASENEDGFPFFRSREVRVVGMEATITY